MFVNSGTEIAGHFIMRLLRDVGYEPDVIYATSWSPSGLSVQVLAALIGPSQATKKPARAGTGPVELRKALVFIEMGALRKDDALQLLSKIVKSSVRSMIITFSTKDFNIAKKFSDKNTSVHLLPLHHLMKPGARSLLRDYSTLIMRTRKRELVERTSRLFLQAGISTRILIYGDIEYELPFTAVNVLSDEADAFVERSLLGIVTEEDFEGYLLASRLYYDGKPVIICDVELREIAYGDIREALIRRISKCNEYDLLKEILSVYRDLEHLRRISVEPLSKDRYEGAVKIIRDFLEGQ